MECPRKLGAISSAPLHFRQSPVRSWRRAGLPGSRGLFSMGWLPFGQLERAAESRVLERLLLSLHRCCPWSSRHPITLSQLLVSCAQDMSCHGPLTLHTCQPLPPCPAPGHLRRPLLPLHLEQFRASLTFIPIDRVASDSATFLLLLPVTHPVRCHQECQFPSDPTNSFF